MLLAVAWAAVRVRQGRWPESLRSPLTAAAALFAVFVALSGFLSIDLARSTRHLPGLSLLLLLPIGMDLCDTVARARAIVLALGGSGFALSLLGLWQFFHDRGSDINERITATLSHYMTFSGLAMIAGCLLVGFALEGRGRWRCAGLLSALPLAVMLLSYTRGVWVGTLAAFALYLAVRRPKGLLVLAPAVVALYLLLPGEIRGRMRSIADPHDATNRDRIAMARAGLRMVADHPLFGVGPDMVKPYYPLYRDSDAVRWQVPHLHNNVLQIAAASGLFAMAAYLALIGLFLWRSVVLLRRETDPGRACLLAGAVLAGVALTAAGLFEYNFGDTEVEMATLLVMALPFSRALATGPA